MKKILLVMVAMTFCVYDMCAQNIENLSAVFPIDSVATNIAPESVEVPPVLDTNATPENPVVLMSYDDVAELFRQFNSMPTGDKKVRTTDDYKNVLYPVEGKSKFIRSQHVDQRIEISLLGGNDDNTTDQSNTKLSNSTADDIESIGDKINSGLNVGYSLVFIPGRIEGDQLHINKFGFGYSLGFLASFDRQKKYDVTCDFLGKIGVETGNGHDIGLGIDFLIGTGKSAGDYTIFAIDEQGNVLYEDDDNMLVINTTEWCFKYGAQLWVRSNLLRTGIGNTDVRLFARYVYSRDPKEQGLFDNSPIFWDWMEESWQFGVTFCYTF